MSLLRYEVLDGVARITLDSPPVNAMGEAMLDALLAALARAREDDAVRVVMLRSDNPKIFCAGLDLAALRQGSPSQMRHVLDKLYPQLCDAQYHLGKPSIAVVGGAARGGGMTLSISCDIIIAADTATFGYPEIDVGVPPAIHFTHLPRIIRRHRAFDLLFTGRSFPAQEAWRLGLVSQVFPAAELQAGADALARTLAGKSAQITRLAREAFMRANDLDYRRGVGGAVETFCNIAMSEDAREGLAAFVEKRRPVWGQDRKS